MKLVQYIIFSTIFVVCSACTSLGIPVTSFEAKRYESIESFIVKNFTVGPSAYLSSDNAVTAKQGILWEARFNKSNQSYLNKPSKDLRTYCDAIGGKIANEPLQEYSTSSRKFVYVDPARAAVDMAQRYNRLFGTSYGSGGPAQMIGESAVRYNLTRLANFRTTNATIDEAYRDGRLGNYSCTSNKEVVWVASIQVESIRPGDAKNMASLPMAILRISGSTMAD